MSESSANVTATETPLPPVQHCVIAEIIGTFILVLFGCGVVHTAVLFGAQAGLWEVAIVWGVAIMLAIYATGNISGAHINPAITITMAVWDGFAPSRVLPYIAAQMTGAFLAAATLYLLFGPSIAAFEREHGIERGSPASIVTASCYGEYYPNPGGLASGEDGYSAEAHAELRKTVPHGVAFIAELLGTAILAIMVFALTETRNSIAPAKAQAAIFIGLTVSILISILAPLTQACFNPARDFAPRIFSALAGWGPVAFPSVTDLSWLTVYIIAPVLGAVLGGGFYKRILQPMYH